LYVNNAGNLLVSTADFDDETEEFLLFKF